MSLNKKQFIGRRNELAVLKTLKEKNSASMVVIRGRRRIGKSRLAEEFAKGMTFYTFAGLAPHPNTDAQTERDIFARQLSEQTGLPEIKADDWGKLFHLLSEKIQKGRIVLLFDEISWMGTHDPLFLSHIKNAWDQKFKKNPKLIFIICGSASAWIEKNILCSTGFLGRVSLTQTLEELPLHESVAFWQDQANRISPYEKLKVLSVTGGIPRYLEEINPKQSAEENIADLCFRRGGILVDEFEHIFSNVFQRNTKMYRGIIEVLLQGPKQTGAISHALKTPVTGLLSEYLQELSICGFITRDHTWNLNKHTDGKLSQYRLSDNYLRFYMQYIQPNKNKINRGAFEFSSMQTLPQWQSIMGLQFENIVIKQRKHILAALHISPKTVANDNPFFQKPTTKQKGCQIDYMIQTHYNTLYVCEIKFSKQPIGCQIIPDMQQKIERIHRPKGFSCRPVLIHVNGVTKDLSESNYFSNIIDFGALAEQP